ncbi:MAG: sugar transferase [Acidobacteria bacterium]|nr:sugar transferase [Acidobacteriota bacterium]
MSERILLLGATPLAAEIARGMSQRPRRYRLAGIVDTGPDPSGAGGGCTAARLLEIVRRTRADRIVTTLAGRKGARTMRVLLEVCTATRVAAEEGTSFYERLTGRIPIELVPLRSIVFSWRFGGLRRASPAISRALSIVAAAVVLSVCAPLLALIAAAIKIDSRGPVLFVQARMGAGGRPFRMLKFRTMRETGGRPSEWEGDNRHRVTRVGWWLRRFRLDELPQFVNILRGEMNLVGPRPHPVSNRELFTLVGRNLNDRTGSAIGYYALRSMAVPGLTGWAQVRYRYANNLEEEIEKLRYDLYYVKHRSTLFDLRILLETVRAVVVAPRPAPPHPAPQARDAQFDAFELTRTTTA